MINSMRYEVIVLSRYILRCLILITKAHGSTLPRPKKKKHKNYLSVQCVWVSVVSNSMIPWTVTRQTPLSMEFSRQESWSGLPFPTPVDHLYPWIQPSSPASLALADEFFTTDTYQIYGFLNFLASVYLFDCSGS